MSTVDAEINYWLSKASGKQKDRFLSRSNTRAITEINLHNTRVITIPFYCCETYDIGHGRNLSEDCARLNEILETLGMASTDGGDFNFKDKSVVRIK